jgi:tetratricopeptide (TPR) repeat protein
LFFLTVSVIYAQVEAQKTFQDAKTAYQAGNFAEARNLAEKAAITDPKNPEVFLLLGQAQYQIGQVDDAVAAWKQTLALAPKEAFAKRMLEVLQAQRVGVDVRITFVETLLAEKLFDPAAQEIKKLLTDKAISETQRAKLLILQAESTIGLGNPLEAEKLLREVMVLYPSQADLVQTSLLLGRAKLSVGGQSAGEGLILLKKIVSEHPDSPEATAARYELMVFDLKSDATPAKAEALAKWIGENPKHAQASDARRVLVESYINLSKQGPKPAADSALNDWDRKALAAAVEFYQSNPQAESAKQLTENVLLGHLFGHYFNNQAYAADLEGLNILLNAQLPREKRLDVLRAIASCCTNLSLKKVGEMARKGELPAGPAILFQRGQSPAFPEFLAQTVSAMEKIEKEYPAETSGRDLRIRLATELRALGQIMPWPDEAVSIRGTDYWALLIVSPVVKSNAEPGAVKQGVDIVQGIINE